jgi:hypothetical protein
MSYNFIDIFVLCISDSIGKEEESPSIMIEVPKQFDMSPTNENQIEDVFETDFEIIEMTDILSEEGKKIS